MLANGHMVETGVKNAVGFATDFAGSCCVGHGREVSLFKANGSPLMTVDYDSAVRSVRWDRGLFHVLTERHSHWLEPNGREALCAELSHAREEVVRTGDGWVAWRPCFCGNGVSHTFGNGDSRSYGRLFRPMSKRRRARLETYCANGHDLGIGICDGGRLAYFIRGGCLVRHRFPEPVARLVEEEDVKLGIGYRDRDVYAYDDDGELRYRTSLHFTVDGIESCERGWVLARNGREFAVLDEAGLTRGIGRSEEPVKACQLSDCGRIVAILTASGRIHELLLHGGAPAAQVALTDVCHVAHDEDERPLQACHLRLAYDDLEVREAELHSQQTQLATEKKENEGRTKTLDDRRAVLDATRKEAGAKLADCGRREAKLRRTRRRLRKLLSMARLPEVMAARIKRFCKDSSQQSMLADRLASRLMKKATEAAEAKSRAETVAQQLESAEDELAQHRATNLELQARLGVRRERLRVAQQDVEASQSRVSTCETELERFAAMADGARTTVARLKAEVVGRRDAIRALARTRSELERLLAKLPHRRDELRKADSRLEETRLALRDMETELAAVLQEREESAAKLHRITRKAGEHRAASEALRTEIEAGELELSTTAKVRAELWETRACLAKRLEALQRVRGELAAKRAAADRTGEECRTQEEAVGEAGATIEALESRLAELRTRGSELERQVNDTKEMVRESEKDRDGLEKRLAELGEDACERRKQVCELGKLRDDAEGKRAYLQGQVQELELEITAADRERDKLAERRRELSRASDEAKAEVERMEQEIANGARLEAELASRREALKYDYEAAQKVKKGLDEVSELEQIDQEIGTLCERLYELVREIERRGQQT